jgi:hypothetical protein
VGVALVPERLHGGDTIESVQVALPLERSELRRLIPAVVVWTWKVQRKDLPHEVICVVYAKAETISMETNDEGGLSSVLSKSKQQRRE